MVGAHLGHNVRLGSNTILANNVILGGYAEVNNYAFIGGGSVVRIPGANRTKDVAGAKLVI
jgi:UDP-N-acetylglucosamine acyltransferase